MAVSITSGLNIFNLKVKAAQSTVTSNVPAAQSNTQQPYLTANPQTPPNTQSTSSSSTVGPKTKNGGQIKVNKTGFKTLAGLEPTADMVLSPEDEKALIDANLGPEKIIEPAKEALEIKDVKDTNKVFGSKNNDVVNDKAFDSSKVDNTKIDTGSVAKVENISEEVLPVELKKAESEVQAKIKEDATAPIIGTIDKSQIPAGTVFTKVELDPLEQNPLVTKGEVTTITDDAKMSPNALKRKKASLASLAGDKKKSPYRFNWGSNRCEFSSSYGKFCHNFFNGVNPGGYPEGITWSDASSSNSYYMGYNWGLGNPWSGIGQDNWSLTSLGYVWLSSGQYTINTVSDDGIRAWVNNQMVIDNWNDHGQTNNYGAISINQQGWYPIQVNFYERAGGAIRTFQISKVIDNTPPQGYSNYNRIEGNRMLLGADAWDYGSGVDRVDFFALYNGGWQYGGYEYNDNRDNIYASWMGFAANTPGQWVTPAARAWDRAGNSSWLQGKAIWFPGNRDTRPPRGRIEQLRWLTDRCVRVEGRAWDESGIDHVAFWWYYNNAWQQYKTESEDGDGYFGQTMCLDDNTYNTASSQNMYLRIDARDRAGNVAITALEDNGANNGQKSILWNAPIRDDAPPDGQITAMNWNYNNNPRCVQVVANAWDTGSRQTGVNGVHFFVGYNGNGNYWHYAGTDWNNGDNIYGQTHCLPDNIPSNTPIETSIHIFDKANRYVYDGSWGNKRTTFQVRDSIAPTGFIKNRQPIHYGLATYNNIDLFGEFNDNDGGSGIDRVEYKIVYGERLGNQSNLQYNQYAPYLQDACTATSKNWQGNWSCNYWINTFANDQNLYFVAVVYDKAGNSRLVGNNSGGTFTVNYESDKILLSMAIGAGIGFGIIAGSAIAASTTATAIFTGAVEAVTALGTAYGVFQCSVMAYNLIANNKNTTDQYIDCGLTVIPIGTILKFGGRAFKVEKLVETGGKKLYKVVETVVDLCKVAFIEPTFVDRLLGTVRASAAGCKIVGKAIQSIASLRKLNIYKGNAVEHVLEGNINNAGAAGGFHHIDSSVGIVDSILNTKTINGLEIYEAKVTINGVRKLGKSTMFPDKWSRQQVIDAIEEANVNKQFVKNEINTYNDIQNNVYRGTTNSGLTIEMYIEQNVNSQDFGKIISAFPVLN